MDRSDQPWEEEWSQLSFVDMTPLERKRLLESATAAEEAMAVIYRTTSWRGQWYQPSPTTDGVRVRFDPWVSQMPAMVDRLAKAEQMDQTMRMPRPRDMSVWDCLGQWRVMRDRLDQLGWDYRTLIDLLDTKLEEKADSKKADSEPSIDVSYPPDTVGAARRVRFDDDPELERLLQGEEAIRQETAMQAERRARARSRHVPQNRIEDALTSPYLPSLEEIADAQDADRRGDLG